MRDARRLLVLSAIFAAALVTTVMSTSADAPAAASSAFDLTLPYSGTVTSGVPAFQVKQAGSGIAGRFEITNPNSAAIALDGVSGGTGHALLAWNLGRGRGAVIITSNSANTLPALDVSSQSNAAAADIRQNNTATTVPALKLSTLGMSDVLLVNQRGPSGGLADFQVGDVSQIRFTRAGLGLFNGGTRSAGTSVAVAMKARGAVTDYKPGDVVAVSGRSDLAVQKSGGRYSTRIVGVVAGRPGTVLSQSDVNTDISDTVTVGVSGIVLTKVNTSNGRIRPGDLIVSSRRAGVGMRGTDRGRMLGAVIGKALTGFSGTGTRRIPVLVTPG